MSISGKFHLLPKDQWELKTSNEKHLWIYIIESSTRKETYCSSSDWSNSNGFYLNASNWKANSISRVSNTNKTNETYKWTWRSVAVSDAPDEVNFEIFDQELTDTINDKAPTTTRNKTTSK